VWVDCIQIDAVMDVFKTLSKNPFIFESLQNRLVPAICDTLSNEGLLSSSSGSSIAAVSSAFFFIFFLFWLVLTLVNNE
jgi:hypothetical protein